MKVHNNLNNRCGKAFFFPFNERRIDVKIIFFNFFQRIIMLISISTFIEIRQAFMKGKKSMLNQLL